MFSVWKCLKQIEKYREQYERPPRTMTRLHQILILYPFKGIKYYSWVLLTFLPSPLTAWHVFIVWYVFPSIVNILICMILSALILLTPTVWSPRTGVQSLGWEEPLEKGTASYSSILVWRIPWMEEPGGLQSVGLQRVKQDWATHTSTVFTFSPQSCPSLQGFS